MLHLELPRYKSIEAIASANKEMISFSQGALKMGGTPKAIKEHIQGMLNTDTLDYYQFVGGIYPLRAKLAEKLSQKFSCTVKVENILITHGAIGALTNLCLTLLKNGDEVILPEPIYPSYRNIVKFSKATPVYIQGFIEQNNAWVFDLEQIKKAYSPRTKMLILSNPCNPCGTYLKQAELEELKNWCEQKGIYLICDEVYDNFIYGDHFASATPKAIDSEFIIRTGSFSKDYAMSGWRIGYVVASEKLIKHMIAVQDGTLCSPSVIGQHAALYALQHEELIEEQVKAVKTNLDLSYSLITPLLEKGVFSCIKPEAGIFLFLKSNQQDSEDLVMDILYKAKVSLVPGKDFGDNNDTAAYIRLCFAREKWQIVEGITRLLNYYQLA